MSYSEAVVESLLATVWDRTYAWGIQNDSTPDPDMPKSRYKSPQEATTFWAHLIDVRIAWAAAPLSHAERKALLLHFAFGWEQKEIAFNQRVSQQAISKRLAKGVREMTEWLNAEYEMEH